MRRILYFIAIVFLLSSCLYTKQGCIEDVCKPQNFNKDTVVTITVHDTIKVKGDSVIFPFDCDSIQAALNGTISQITLYNDSLYKIVIERPAGSQKPIIKTVFKDRLLIRNDTITKKVTLQGTSIQVERELKWWQTGLMCLGGLFILCIPIWLRSRN